MNFPKFRLVVLATALGGAMGIACAQQAGPAIGASGSVATTPAAGKAAVGVSGNAALTSETAVSGTPMQGSPGTQSGVAVSPDTATLGASAAPVSGARAWSQSFAGLSNTQMHSLQRYNALR